MSDPSDDEDASVPMPPTPPQDATGPVDEVEDEATADEPSTTSPLSDEDIRDALPEDLDAAGYVGPYLFPNNNRRRIPAYLYWAISAVTILVWFLRRDHDPVLVNDGVLVAAIVLALIGAYSFVSGWNLDVDEREALVAATRQVGFPVGHASAQMGWRGLLSRPTWRILLYSADDPPDKRGLVLVDGVDGSIIEWFVEDNPEDWTDLS
jgi:hypothetical protein